jgi:hypothetical protein
MIRINLTPKPCVFVCLFRLQTPEPGAQARSAAADEAQPAAGPEDSQAELAAEEQPHKKQRNNRVHAWVLVLPGRREVSCCWDALFADNLLCLLIEPEP